MTADMPSMADASWDVVKRRSPLQPLTDSMACDGLVTLFYRGVTCGLLAIAGLDDM